PRTRRRRPRRDDVAAVRPGAGASDGRRSAGPQTRQRLSCQPHRNASRTRIMASFQGIDYYDIDSLLSEEERMVRDTVRAWVDDNLLPIIEDAYINRTFPKELIPQMAELGIYGANLPEEYGCAGLNNVAYGLIMQEL